MGDDEAYARVEVPVFAANVAFVHVRIPPCTTIGHKADFWGVDKPDFTCRLACFTRGDALVLRLHELKSDEVFAECMWEPGRPLSSVVEPATDSSRYFAVKITNPETGVHTFIGMGFGERDTASEFKAALLEHQSYLDRMREAEAAREKRKHQPEVDLSLKTPTVVLKLPTSDTSKRRAGGLMSRPPTGMSLFSSLSPGSAKSTEEAAPAVGCPRVSGSNTGTAATAPLLESAPAVDAPEAARRSEPVVYDDDDFGDFVT